MVAAFGNDASAKLGPLIQKFQGALSAAGGAEALAAQVRWQCNTIWYSILHCDKTVLQKLYVWNTYSTKTFSFRQ
jgi:hypothetical protein